MKEPFRLMLAEDAAIDLQPGDCLLVVEIQRPGYGARPYVGFEYHDAYPMGLDAGPYNDEHAGSREAIERALDLQAQSLERRHVTLVRQCASGIIEDFQGQRVGAAEPWDATLEQVLAGTNPEVAELVRAHQNDAVGICSRCKTNAPLSSGTCVWGCLLGKDG